MSTALVLKNYQGNLALVNVLTFKLGGVLTAISIQSVLVSHLLPFLYSVDIDTSMQCCRLFK